MPLKSWAFMHDGHIVRTEIWWRLWGWNRKRVFVDHEMLASLRGRFTASRPMAVECGKRIAFRFRRRWLGLDMGCEVSSDGEKFVPVTNAFVDKHWQVLGWDVDHEPQTGRNFGCLILIPILLMMVPVYPVLMVIGGLMEALGDWRLRRRMKGAGRYLSWGEIEARMKLIKTPCTVIGQMGNLARHRVWWTADDVVGESPLPRPSEVELLMPGRSDHPFSTWCAGKYFDSAKGSAFLTDLPADFIDAFGVFDESDDYSRARGKYPLLNVVSAGYAPGKIGRRFYEIVGEDLEAALPRLAEGSADENRELRRLCLKCIGFLGEKGKTVVPLLKERFYFGAEGDRYLVADTLAKLGSTGHEVLNWAQYSGDPRIRGHAQSGLRHRERPVEPVARIRIPRVRIDPELKKMRARRERLAIVFHFTALAGLIGLIVASGWYLGTVTTLVIFIVVAVSAVGISIGWLYWKIRKRVQKNQDTR